MTANEVTEQDRFPLLDKLGQQMLNRISQHPHAPNFNYHCGEKLMATGLRLVHQFADDLQQEHSLNEDGLPDWLVDHVRHCWDDVPYFRERDQRLQASPTGECPPTADLPFTSIPFTDRDDLRRQPWSFVPDSADLDELIVYSTSGTTGNLLSIICHPSVPASYLPLFEAALAEHGVRIEGGKRVSILHIAAQHSTYTLHSTMSYFGGAGFAKVNLNPSEWRSPEDRKAFIDDCDAEIYTGDPFAFLELSKLAIRTRPKAILSSATTLLPATRDQLMSHFRCPVIDIYSMNETGPIAYAWQDHHRFFPHRIHIEIVDAEGNVLPNSQFGELVVTGGINPWMPLLRYRTGDMGALKIIDGHSCLVNFSGRTPVDFYRPDGSLVRSIDVTVALYSIPLTLFRLHQAADGSLHFDTRCSAANEQQVASRLRDLFGTTPITIEQLVDDSAWQGKAIQYTSDLHRKDSHTAENNSQ